LDIFKNYKLSSSETRTVVAVGTLIIAKNNTCLTWFVPPFPVKNYSYKSFITFSHRGTEATPDIFAPLWDVKSWSGTYWSNTNSFKSL